MIDAWAYRPGDPVDKNIKSDQTNQDTMKLAESVGATYGQRAKIMRSLSTTAAENFEDSYFDWIYIDALHTESALLKDLHAWYPKVRDGGLISGDDFGDVQDTETIN